MMWLLVALALVIGYLIGRYCRPGTPAVVAQEAPTQLEPPPVTPAKYRYDPDTHKLIRHCVVVGLLLTAAVSSQAGNIAVMDPFTKGPKNLVPGAGIAFTGTTISATGVPAGGVTDITFKNYTGAEGGRATNDRVDFVQEQVTGQATGAALGATALQPGAPATSIANTPAGSIAATDVDAALRELDAEKATAAQGAKADSALQPGNVVNDLISGGVAVPLSAEQGKSLQTSKQELLTGVAGFDLNATGTGDRNGLIDLHASDLAAQSDYSSRIIRSNGDGGLRFFNRYANSNPAGSYAFYFSSDNASAGNSGGNFTIANGGVFHRITAPTYAWNMWPAVEHSVEFPLLGVGGANSGFAQWLVSAGPTPAQVAANSNGANWGIIGSEINTFERTADAGYMESRVGRFSVGLQLVPESELSIFGGAPQQGYNGSFGLMIGGSDASAPRTYPSAKWHVPLMIHLNGTAPGGTSMLLRGGGDDSNDPNIAVKIMDYQNIGIDTSSATMASDAIRLGPTHTIGDGTNSYTLAQLAEGGSAGTPASTVTTQAFADAGTVGVSTDYARGDHKHAMPITPLTTTSMSASSGVATSRAQPDLDTANRYSVVTTNYTATDTTPAVGSSLAGIDINAQYSGDNSSGNAVDAVYGAFLSARNTGVGRVDNLGNYSWLRNTSTGTVKYLDNFFAKSPTNAGTLSAGGRSTGFYSENMGLTGMAASYGLFIANQSGSTLNYAIKTGTGKVEFGDNVTVSGDILESVQSTATDANLTATAAYSKLTVTTTTQRTVTLPAVANIGMTTKLIEICGTAVVPNVAWAAGAGSVTWGDTGAPTFTSGKCQYVSAITTNTVATSTAAWRLMTDGRTW